MDAKFMALPVICCPRRNVASSHHRERREIIFGRCRALNSAGLLSITVTLTHIRRCIVGVSSSREERWKKVMVLTPYNLHTVPRNLVGLSKQP